MQRSRSARNHHRVLGSHSFGQGRFKLINHRSSSEPIGAQELNNGLDIVLLNPLSSIRDRRCHCSTLAVLSLFVVKPLIRARASSLPSQRSFVSLRYSKPSGHCLPSFQLSRSHHGKFGLTT